jgi:hypothetical protein
MAFFSPGSVVVRLLERHHGNFAKIAASGAPETLNSGAVAGFPMQIPYSKKQRIILGKQGILAQEQGILSVIGG